MIIIFCPLRRSSLNSSRKKIAWQAQRACCSLHEGYFSLYNNELICNLMLINHVCYYIAKCVPLNEYFCFIFDKFRILRGKGVGGRNRQQSQLSPSIFCARWKCALFTRPSRHLYSFIRSILCIRWKKNQVTNLGHCRPGKVNEILNLYWNNNETFAIKCAFSCRFQTITATCYRGAQGIMLVYDVTDEKSFKNISKWVQKTQELANPNVQKMLVANKCDLKKQRLVTREKGELLAQDLDIRYAEISALSNLNVEDAFATLTQDVLNNFVCSSAESWATLTVEETTKQPCCAQ